MKELKGNCLSWYVFIRPTSTIYQSNPITKLKGIGKAKAKKFIKASIITILDLIVYSNIPPGFTNKA